MNGSNKLGKQTVHGLKCHLEKCHKDELSGIPSTRTTCKKAKLDEVLAKHFRADLVTECMKMKTRFWAENECQFSFSSKLFWAIRAARHMRAVQPEDRESVIC